MKELVENDVRLAIVDCLENAGVDKNIVANPTIDNNALTIMDSLQYLAFISELESKLGIYLIDDFLLPREFTSIDDFTVKLEYYVKGWVEANHRIYLMEGDDLYETEEVT